MDVTYRLDRGISLTRLFDAPPDVVFDAWTKPEALGWFFNPDNPTDIPVEVDLRVGGAWRQMMIINADNQYVTGGVYREIVPGKRLSFYWGARGGWPALDPEKLEDSPVCTISFTPKGNATEMRFRVLFPDHYSPQTVEEWLNCGMVPGWNMTIDRLVDVLGVPA